jgi:hypothetical protein
MIVFVFVFIFLILIIILLILYYIELPRYIKCNNKNWNDLIKLEQKYHLIPRVKTKRRTVVSMTTIPSRFNKIAPTLCSILSQSRRVDEIRLNIPYKSMKGDKYNIPNVLKILNILK